MMDYIVVEASTPQQMRRLVLAQLKDGYTVQGGITSVSIYPGQVMYSQAMVKNG